MVNNDRGGGFLLWGINFIRTKLRNRKIRKHNQQARGVETHQNIAVGSLFPPQSYQENIIISGGGQNERLYLCETLILNAHNANHPHDYPSHITHQCRKYCCRARIGDCRWR